MLGGIYPAMPTPDEVWKRAAALQGSANDNVKDQHVVSKVLLKQFAERDHRDCVYKVASYDLEHPASSKPRAVAACGRAPTFDFVPFASRSVERRWGAIETTLPETFSAIANGTFFDDPIHTERVRDLIVLHFVRSIQSDVIRWRTWDSMYAQARRFWQQRPRALEQLARQRPGFYVAGVAGQEETLNELHAQAVELMESGKYFRVMIEDRFERTRTWLQGERVELLTPADGEFLIGDIPALLMLPGYVGNGAFDEVGLLAADSLVLPLGPKCLAKLGGASQMTLVPAETVEALNAAQVRCAFARVFFRPGSDLDQVVQSVERPRPSEGSLRDAYARYRA